MPSDRPDASPDTQPTPGTAEARRGYEFQLNSIRARARAALFAIQGDAHVLRLPQPIAMTPSPTPPSCSKRRRS